MNRKPTGIFVLVFRTGVRGRLVKPVADMSTPGMVDATQNW